ncbi:unnamed protein product [Lampetra fluviatilis]
MSLIEKSQWRRESSAADSRMREGLVAQPAHAAAILLVGREGEPANSESLPRPPVDIPLIRRRRPFVKQFTTAGGDQRATLLEAFAQMAAIYDPLSNVRHKFATRRSREADTPLTFRSALLALAKAATTRSAFASTPFIAF